MDTKQKNRGSEPGRRPRPEKGQHSASQEEARKRSAQQKGAGTEKRKAPPKQTQRRREPQKQDNRRKPQGQEPQRRTMPQQEQRRSPSAQRNAAARRGAARSNATGRSRPVDYRSREQAKRARQTGTFQTKRRVRPPRKNAVPVVYTQPTPFNVNRLLIQLLTVSAVVLALTLSLSLFFKVEVITVSGAEAYSEWAIREASGIEEGESLLTFSRARAGGRIKMELPYVDKVRFGIKLPNTVIIDIEELDVVYAIQSRDGLWWLITSDGRVIEQTDGGTAGSYTKVEGVTLESPAVNQQAVAAEKEIAAPTEAASTDPSGASGDPLMTTPTVITAQDRLNVALEILQALELNDIVGEAASVNVTSLNDIELWYGTRYRVRLGGSDDLDYKIACMKDAVAQMSDYQMGILDISFDQWADKVGYTPFE